MEYSVAYLSARYLAGETHATNSMCHSMTSNTAHLPSALKVFSCSSAGIQRRIGIFRRTVFCESYQLVARVLVRLHHTCFSTGRWRIAAVPPRVHPLAAALRRHAARLVDLLKSGSGLLATWDTTVSYARFICASRASNCVLRGSFFGLPGTLLPWQRALVS